MRFRSSDGADGATVDPVLRAGYCSGAVADEERYDFGHLGEATPFHVSEYMNGGTLSQQVRDHGPLDAVETLKVSRAMCDALAEAHTLGIVHRDVKPHNILFAVVGNARLAKLADFGLSRPLAAVRGCRHGKGAGSRRHDIGNPSRAAAGRGCGCGR